MVRRGFPALTFSNSRIDASQIRPRPIGARRHSRYNHCMTIAEKIHQDMIAAMKAREELKLSTLRMMKSGVKSKEIDKRAPLTDAETLQILSTMIKQRKDSIEQFTKGGRPELAAKEAAEIELIETYMPKSAGEEEIQAAIREVLAGMSAPTAKDVGPAMKAVMAKFAATGQRVDGKQVNELLRKALA